MPVGLNENPVGMVDPACPIEWSHQLNRGLVSRWKVIPNCGWRGGLTFRDLVRGGRKPADGTLTNGPVWSARSNYGGNGSISFDGSNDYVLMASQPLADSLTDISISFWYRTDASTASMRPFIKGTSIETIANQTGGGASGTMCLYLPGIVVLETGTGYVVGQWRHFVGVIRGSASAKIYIDGIERATASISGFSSGTGLFRLGTNNSGGEQYTGLVDDACVFSRALSSTEPLALFKEQLRGSTETLRWVGAPSYGVSDQAAPAAGNLFRYANLSGLQGGGPFFVNPLGA